MFIQDIPSDRKFWVVRSDNGKYFYHFLRHSIVAIGHLDDLDYSESSLINNQENEEMLMRYRRSLINADKQPSSVSNNIGQVSKFINEMNVGDYIITLSPDLIAVGSITSEAYKSIENITIQDDGGATSDVIMEYSLRRNVAWGKMQARNKLPLAVNNSFRANQTVFSASEHWKALNHWMAVAFISDDEAYVSSRIEQAEGISNLDIAQYSTILNKIEAIANLLVNNQIEGMTNEELIELLHETYAQLIETRTFTVTTQQVFLSPGDLWAKVSGERNKSLIFVCAFLMMFDIPLGFASEEDERFIHENSTAIVTMINDVKLRNNFDDVQYGLKLRVPEQKIQEENYIDTNIQDIDYELDNFEGI